MTWQPIETAPRDGTWVLLYGGDSDGRCAYMDGHDVVAAYFDPDDGLLEVYAPKGTTDFWRFGDWDGGVYGAWCDPTHWMPLPQPPETTK